MASLENTFYLNKGPKSSSNILHSFEYACFKTEKFLVSVVALHPHG